MITANSATGRLRIAVCGSWSALFYQNIVPNPLKKVIHISPVDMWISNCIKVRSVIATMLINTRLLRFF